MTFKAKISKEEINVLPLEAFEGGITQIEDAAAARQAVAVLRSFPAIGIDTETRPSFSKGVRYKVALFQASTADHCYLFRLNKMEDTASIFDLLSDKNVKKIGLSLRDDISGLSKRHSFKPQNFIDIQSIAQRYGILELSLQKIYAIVFEKKISKAQRLTNWENDVLSSAQQVYAATDAWAALRIYNRLQQEKALSPKQLTKLISEQNSIVTTEKNEQEP